MHPAVEQATDSDEPRTRCWLGLPASYETGARLRNAQRRDRSRSIRRSATAPTYRSPMSEHARAGQPARPADLVDVAALLRAYHDLRPDPSDPAQRVAFGT